MIRWKTLPLAGAVWLLAMPAGRGQTIPGWTMVWADEFSQPDGSSPDPARWNFDTGGGGWGNNELQHYTARPENARIEGGRLVIEARRENFGGNAYTSARLVTRDRMTWTHGRIEARIKVPRGQGIWPAFWMLGANIGSVGWPNCGEIDIMENIGREPRTVHGTIHGPGYSGAGGFGGAHVLDADLADDFHLFAVEWEAGVIRWFVDGIHYFTATPADLGGSPWVFEQPQYLILNVAVGGNWPGNPDPGSEFPRQMLVDHVRVYSKTGAPEPNRLANPGFESGGLAPWTGYSPGGANAPGGFIESPANRYYNGGNPGGDPVITHGGTRVAKTFGDFSGAENYNGFYQDVAAAAGSRWSADAWALTHPQDLLSGAASAWLEVSFRDAAGSILALHRSPVLTSATITAGRWIHLPVAERLDPVTRAVIGAGPLMTAPAGTAKARCQVVFRQPGFDAGSVYFDDLRLVERTIVLPQALETAAVGGSLRLSFPTQLDVPYQVACKDDLSDPGWVPIDGVTGDSTVKTFVVPIDRPRRFFVLQVP